MVLLPIGHPLGHQCQCHFSIIDTIDNNRVVVVLHHNIYRLCICHNLQSVCNLFYYKAI